MLNDETESSASPHRKKKRSTDATTALTAHGIQKVTSVPLLCAHRKLPSTRSPAPGSTSRSGSSSVAVESKVQGSANPSDATRLNASWMKGRFASV